MGFEAEKILPEVLNAFDFGCEIVDCERFGGGHINDTFCAQCVNGKRFIVQRISSEAFKDPVQLMENTVNVTEYLREIIAANGGDTERETMTVIRTKTGDVYYTASNGDAWRATLFVANTVCLQSVTCEQEFYAAAKAFGNFQHLLSDYPAETLHETIARFHDTESRFENLEKAVKADILGRAKNCQKEIEFAFARKADCGKCMQALRDGVLPLRVTHNDTKLNNILFDKDTNEAVCVIDLDTVMPGLSINDFGDSIRFGANHCAEDEPDLSKVNFDIDLYDAYTRGFLEGAAGTLTQKEIEYLPWGAKLMTLECGMRFLTDYLQGDTYFHIQRDGQNLDRCRTQFKLVSDMEKQWDDMAKTAQKYV